ncbi:MAG: chemotaxis protein CheB [Candidatus Omnitrophota bacterium]|jgi:two-component system CheB/CheR fusion protein
MKIKKVDHKRKLISQNKNNATVKVAPVSGEGLNNSCENSFPVVGIGASAGGLAAFEAFFSAIPVDQNMRMAFVLVQHLAPDHKSILSDLIRRYTRMQVFEVEDGMVVRQNCVYIIPPNRDMALLNGHLQLLEKDVSRGHGLSIDFFFRSLAQDQHERAIGIILSGTGSDGVMGVRAIKGEGGMVLTQKPESTEYDGMPRSAIATGLMDYVLLPAEMPLQLLVYARHAFGQKAFFSSIGTLKAEDALKKIFIILRDKSGHDFSQYKPITISRRIERRMAVHQINRLEDYVRYLQKTPVEVEALFYDLLIGVTSFFRDPEVFNTLEAQVIPRLFADKPAGSVIRVWVPGCSTGEEAYSLAILLQEKMEELKQSFRLQVFASDIDSRAIAQARRGVYPSSIAADVSPQRLARFFISDRAGTTFSVHKNIRDVMVFSEHDLIKDPPFSKLDLISCRNLLIYMGGELQKKIILLFHYALNPAGILLLGTSETVSESLMKFFNVMDRKAKMYERCEDSIKVPRLSMSKAFSPMRPCGAEVAFLAQESGENKLHLRELMERTILQQYACVGLLVNDRGDILYIHGRTGRYLEPSPGESVMNILRMAREGLQPELSVALCKAVKQHKVVCCKGLRVKTNGNFSIVNVTVRPAIKTFDTAAEPRLFMVILEESLIEKPELLKKGKDIQGRNRGGKSSYRADARIKALERQLQVTKEHLQSTLEEMQVSGEELRSSNEELQSLNEEMQSTNEEMETAKEELQSVNEELSTVNCELQTKVAELSRVNNDMNNLISGIGIGTIFVDHQLRIQRFTPAVTQVINLISTDVGRSVGHIVSNLVGYDCLVADIQSVLDTLLPQETQVQSKSGVWYQLNIRPYRTLENMIEGAVITFVDISQMKQADEALRRANNDLSRLATVVRDSYDAITVQDLEGRILAWNQAAVKLYGWAEAEALSMNISDLIPKSKLQDEAAIVKKLRQCEIIAPYRTQRLAKNGRIIEVLLTVNTLVNEAGKVYALATTEKEVK